MTFLCIRGPDDQNRWIRKNCPKFFHRVIFAFWIQICKPHLCKSHIFWITANIEKLPFFLHTRTWWRKSVKLENCPKFFHRVIFAFWVQICNPNLCKSHIFELQLILRNDLFLHTRTWWPKSMKSEKLPEMMKLEKLPFFHRVIFAFWIQICNPNLCKSHIFWITANIEKWSFFAHADLMTKIDELGKWPEILS